MKYLFAAIDARQARSRGHAGSHANGRSSRHRFDPQHLKRLVVEASEAVDDKSAANDFQETLERIVNEIKNTTEHSGPFLQKVRKADVPDYFDVIKHPMDLATLLKKVKQQSYRTKKAFADDLDLIWSNCLLYNSHPTHPLRASAEALRAKSNQLLEFITDPAVTQRSFLVASLSSAAQAQRRDSSSRFGTPDEDAEGESDDEARSKRALSQRLLNHVNGDATRDSSASPAPVQPLSAGVARRLSRKEESPLPSSPTPEPTPPIATELPFEETPAFIRTSTSMQEFLLLEQELAKLEGSGFNPTRAATILPRSVYEPSPSAETQGRGASQTKARVADLVRHLNPRVLPGDSPAGSSSSPNGTAAPPELPSTSAHPTRDPSEPLEALWWDIVGPSSSSSLLFGGRDHPPAVNGTNGTASRPEDAASVHVPKAILPPLTPALSAAMPHVPWLGYQVTPYETSAALPPTKQSRKAKGKGTATSADRDAGKGQVAHRPKKQEPRKAEGIASRMEQNCETLRKIRRVGSALTWESSTAEVDAPVISSDESADEDRPRKRRRVRSSAFLNSHLTKQSLRAPATSAVAARESMRTVSGGVLAHAGFEGTSPAALDTLGQLAGQYLANLGRTLRFYSDRYDGDLDPSQIVSRTLSENGVPTPEHLRSYVRDDVDQYGDRLSELLGRLERTRKDRLDSLDESESTEQAATEEALFARDGEAFMTGDYAPRIGEDFFALAEQGLDVELGLGNLDLPKWIFRGDPRPLENEATGSLAYLPPPAFVPLTQEGIAQQIGLLRPYYTLRASKPEYGLAEDSIAHSNAASRPKTAVRHKVPPHGRIPFKGKKRPDDPTLPATIAAQIAGAAEPKKKRKKTILEETVVADSGAE